MDRINYSNRLQDKAIQLLNTIYGVLLNKELNSVHTAVCRVITARKALHKCIDNLLLSRAP